MHKENCRGRLGVFLILLLSVVFVAHGQRTYRLLVLYSPAASKSWIGTNNIRNWVNTNMINEVNTIYSKSADHVGDPPIYRVELAGIDSVTYTEVDQNWDLDSLRRGFGAFRQVSALRTRYSADVVIFVSGADRKTYSGLTHLSNTYYANPGDAFSVIHMWYIQNLYSSAHEVGHMFGCMHAWWNKPVSMTKSKWLYGHGWGDRPAPTDSVSHNWGSVMCFTDHRQEFFSNPDKYFNGDPCGKTDSADNARVHVENFAKLDSFFNPPATVAIGNDTIASQQYGDVMATNSITTSANLRVSGELRLRATQSITINSGFTVDNGGVLTVVTGSGALGKQMACEQPSPSPRMLETVTFPSLTSLNVRVTKANLNVHYSLKEDVPVTFILLTLDGRTVLEKKLGVKTAGPHTTVLHTPWRLGRQRYFMVMSAGKTLYRQVVMFER